MITQTRKTARSKARKLSVTPKPKVQFNLPYKRKCWGKDGVKWVNLIAQATYNNQRFADEISYAQ